MSLKKQQNKLPFISIVIPCYNVESYIYKGLESILNQTYNNWECILVNDGSLDDTEKEILTWANKDDRFKLISQKNKGVSAARNTGIRHAKGECIYFFDPDDVISKDCLDSLTKIYHPGLDIVIGKNAEVFHQTTENANILEHNIETGKELTDSNFVALALKKPFLTVCWNNLYSAEFIFSNQLKFQEGIVHEDELWYFETLYLAKNIIFNSQVTYFYNIANQNSITKNYGFNNLESYLAVINTIHKKYYLAEKDDEKKIVIGTYILNLQITVTAGFFRFIKKNKELPYKAKGAILIKAHLESCPVDKHFDITPQKAIQFDIFTKYGKIDPKIAFQLIRNTNKKNILKSFENMYLKYLLNKLD